MQRNPDHILHSKTKVNDSSNVKLALVPKWRERERCRTIRNFTGYIRRWFWRRQIWRWWRRHSWIREWWRGMETWGSSPQRWRRPCRPCTACCCRSGTAAGTVARRQLRCPTTLRSPPRTGSPAETGLPYTHYIWLLPPKKLKNDGKKQDYDRHIILQKNYFMCGALTYDNMRKSFCCLGGDILWNVTCHSRLVGNSNLLDELILHSCKQCTTSRATVFPILFSECAKQKNHPTRNPKLNPAGWISLKTEKGRRKRRCNAGFVLTGVWRVVGRSSAYISKNEQAHVYAH